MPFPLPLVAFEEYMLADDRPAYPMNFFFRMRFSGRLCRDAIQAALEQVAVRHPMVTARILIPRHRRAYWDTIPEAHIPLRIHSISDRDESPQCQGIDITASGGLVCHLLESSMDDHLLWQFHHACCDGVGALQVLQDWLIAYAIHAEDRIPENALKPLENHRLPGRGRFGLTPWRLLKKARRQAVGLFGVRQFLMRKPVPIVPEFSPGSDDELPACYPAAATHMFTRDQSRSVRLIAQQSGCTINDLLARDLFLALAQFRHRHAFGNPDQWLRLSVPMNLRRASDRKLPATNVVSMVFLDRCGPILNQPEQLLHSIHDEMQLIKTHELGLTFILSLGIVRRLPGGLAGRRDRYQCSATCLFTNVGDLFTRIPVPRDDQSRLVVGGRVLESLDLIAPIRPLTGVAITPFHYAKRLGITIHHDPRMLQANQAAELLQDYVDCIMDSSSLDMSC